MLKRERQPRKGRPTMQAVGRFPFHQDSCSPCRNERAVRPLTRGLSRIVYASPLASLTCECAVVHAPLTLVQKQMEMALGLVPNLLNPRTRLLRRNPDCRFVSPGPAHRGGEGGSQHPQVTWNRRPWLTGCGPVGSSRVPSRLSSRPVAWPPSGRRRVPRRYVRDQRSGPPQTKAELVCLRGGRKLLGRVEGVKVICVQST